MTKVTVLFAPSLVTAADAQFLEVLDALAKVRIPLFCTPYEDARHLLAATDPPHVYVIDPDATLRDDRRLVLRAARENRHGAVLLPDHGTTASDALMAMCVKGFLRLCEAQPDGPSASELRAFLRG